MDIRTLTYKIFNINQGFFPKGLSFDPDLLYFVNTPFDMHGIVLNRGLNTPNTFSFTMRSRSIIVAVYSRMISYRIWLRKGS